LFVKREGGMRRSKPTYVEKVGGKVPAWTEADARETGTSAASSSTTAHADDVALISPRPCLPAVPEKSTIQI
jgi:hypothetical protein